MVTLSKAKLWNCNCTYFNLGWDFETDTFTARHADEAPHMDPNYCGQCYGAPAPPNAIKTDCCNTCAEVRDAYAAISWSFGRGENVEQCEREHYADFLDEQRREGCRIEGGIRVNKVVGNFHFAPGKSFSNGQQHVHDLENYFASSEQHTFTHEIHHLRFGPQLSDDVIKRFGGKSGMAWTNHHISPLDRTEQKTDERAFNFMYFVKVVPTAFLPLGWDKKDSNLWSGSDTPHELIELGKYVSNSRVRRVGCCSC